MKYIDVTRATFSNLDTLQEKRIDDLMEWIEVYQILGKDSRSTFIERKTSHGIHVVREETNKKSSNFQTTEFVVNTKKTFQNSRKTSKF